MVTAIPVDAPAKDPTPADNARAKAKAAAKDGGSKNDMPLRFNIPASEEFDEAENEYLPAPDLRFIAKKVIEQTGEPLSHVDLSDVDFAWKRKGGKKFGRATFGACVKQNDIAKLHGGHTWLIWLAADNCEPFVKDENATKAAVFHELRHIGFVYDDKTGESKPTVNPHDVEMFYDEVQIFGPWKIDLTVARNVFEQLRMSGI